MNFLLRVPGLSPRDNVCSDIWIELFFMKKVVGEPALFQYGVLT